MPFKTGLGTAAKKGMNPTSHGFSVFQCPLRRAWVLRVAQVLKEECVSPSRFNAL